MAALSPGSLIDGKYKIVRTLGEGGMGVVYVAEHAFLRKHFAVKLLRPEFATHAEAAHRFEQEARATSLMEHENIVRVTDFGRTPAGELYLVMELLSGRALAEELAETPKLPPERSQWITKQVLSGLEAAHAQDIIHRDLKPENVFVCARTDGTERVKLVDFGIAKLNREASLRLTTTGSVMGTPQYMAPEQARGLPDIDHRTDLHAVGVMLYEMLAGRAPYVGENFHQVLAEILTVAPPPLVSLAPEIDPALAAIVERAIAKKREDRFPSAKAFREALEAYAMAPSHDYGATVIDVPLVVDLVALDAPEATRPAAPVAARVAAPAEAPPRPAPSPAAAPAPVRASHAPRKNLFAPPEEESDRPLELVVVRPKSARKAVPDQGPGQAAYVELTAHKRAAQAPAVFMRRLLFGLAGVVVLGLIVSSTNLLGSASPPPLAKVTPARAVVQLDGLPDRSYVTLDGIRTVLNPIEMPLSGSTRELHIECDGYREKTLRFVASQPEITLDAHLEKIAKAAAADKASRREAKSLRPLAKTR